MNVVGDKIVWCLKWSLNLYIGMFFFGVFYFKCVFFKLVLKGVFSI